MIENMATLPIDPNIYKQQMLDTTTKSNLHQDAQEAATQFEEQFVFFMLEEMTKSLPVNKQFGGGYGEKVFRTFFNQEIAKEMSRDGSKSLGIADSVYAEIIKLQEGGQQ